MEGVCLTQAEIDASKRNKAAGRYRTVSQIPSYRDAIELCRVVTRGIRKCPQKLRIVAENVDQMCNTLLFDITIAFEDETARKEALTDSLAMVKTIYVRFSDLQQLAEMPLDDRKLFRSKTRSLIAQLAAWRNSVTGQRPAKSV